ncbi:Tpr-related protein family member, putative [Theileria annulata]|uniref:Tpr-related protein family member, putative n=1 Tax=Theileria annulata TaxID=5874 RepID=Q4UBV0_THEAN|nr:Tpr-related protein family member, putative [Theileria annulata]CAI75701.1 Tpr-related protein family member, putative [Theileria annulata]|eukprot:XP_955177.1 Tpr-related protein family member, putative [Theileria annulata]
MKVMIIRSNSKIVLLVILMILLINLLFNKVQEVINILLLNGTFRSTGIYFLLTGMILGNIIEQVYNHTQDTSIGIHGPKLKDAATGLSGLAGTLSSNASSLHSALGSSTDQATIAAKEKVNKLKDAASKADDPSNKGLEQLLNALSSANASQPADIVAKAKDVLAKYNDVVSKYNDVKNDAKANKKPEFNNVKNAFNALQTEFDKIKRIDKFYLIIVPSIVTQWLNFLTYVILLIVYVIGNIVDLFQKLYNGGPVIRAIIEKATDIQTQASSIQSATITTNNKLKNPAEQLKQEATTLNSKKTVENARAFKEKYDKFETAYEAAGSDDQSDVKSDWESLKKIIDGANLTEENKKIKFYSIIVPSIICQWLNFITYVVIFVEQHNNSEYFQATKLNEAAGVDKDKGLLELARELYTQANELHGAMGDDDAPGKQEAENLKTAVGEETENGLANALKALNDALPGDLNLTTLAKAVKDKYGKVKTAYDNLVEQNRLGKYTQSKGQEQYPGVVNEWNVFNNAKNYDVQNTNTVPQLLKDKATELQGKATALSTQAGSGVGTVTNVATNLRDAAATLNEKASTLKDAGLDALSVPATALKDAAKGSGASGDTSLYKTAEALVSGTDYDKAKEVIEAFSKVKDAHENLASHPTYKAKLQEAKGKPPGQPSPPESAEGKVKAVEDQYQLVKISFEALCKALIKHFAGEIATNARDLASGTDKSSEVINSFEVVDSSYNQLDDKSSLKSEFNTVKLIYDGMLNLSKLHKAAGELNTAASGGALTKLRNAANQLVSKITDLRDQGDDKAHTNAKTVVTNFNDVKDKFNKLTANKESVNSQFQALNSAYGHIIIHYPKILQNAAGEEKNQGLRQLAQDLHDKAEALHNAVIDPGGGDAAAKVLQAKAGEDDKTDGTLRKLAKDLYDAVSNLYNAAKATGGDDENTSATFAWVIGSGENKDGLRNALRQLAGNPTSNLQGVRENYYHVKNKFDLVQKQNKKGTYTGAAKAAYDKVVDAMTEFDNVYKPEELLKEAVGELQQALQQLADANILNLHTKAENVKKKFEGFGTGVKSKFELVEKQASAYEAALGNFKTDKYNPLVTDFDNFYKAYRNAVCSPKFYSIIVPSIFSILSDLSPRTKYVYHGKNRIGNGFHGWTTYTDHQGDPNDHTEAGETKPCTDPLGKGTHVPVHAWICHFFDLLIYCLHYRESHRH